MARFWAESELFALIFHIDMLIIFDKMKSKMVWLFDVRIYKHALASQFVNYEKRIVAYMIMI